MSIKTKKEILEILDNYKDDDLFEFSKVREKTLRSKFQNKYYFWVIIKMIWKQHGYSPVETHNLIKLTVWIETTTDLSKWEFKFMIDLIRDLWQTKYEFYIPLPNEVEDLKNLEQYF